jgi:gliding motility-associated-like protein
MPIDILWSTGENSPALDGLSGGTYTVTVTDGVGCAIEQSFDIIEPAELAVDVVPLEPTCFDTEDGQITINSIEGGTAPYMIYNNDIFLSETDGMTYIIGNLASGDYQIRIEDQNGCSTEQMLTIAEVPVLNLTLGADRNVGLGQNIQLDPLLNFTPNTFEWIPPLYLDDPTALRPVATPEDDITYVFFAAFSADCFVQDSISIQVDKTKKVYIPNAFSPNDDGFNDRFTIYSDISVRQINKMQVFDRWGEMIFENDDFFPNSEAEGWNGKFRDEILNPGLYVYVVEIEFIDGEVQTFSGDVLLLR